MQDTLQPHIETRYLLWALPVCIVLVLKESKSILILVLFHLLSVLLQNHKLRYFNTDIRNKLTGKLGEELASFYLTSNYYEVILRNYKNKVGEIDIIALSSFRHKSRELIFIEVKSQLKRTNQQDFALKRLDTAKGQKIKRVAQEFIKDSINIKKQYKFKFKFNALVVHIYWERNILSSKYCVFHFK